MPVAEPHKELRFTRCAQAVPFWLAAAVFLGATLTLLAIGLYRHDNPALPHPAWALVPLLVALLCTRLALHCTRHAYLILSPLGVEIFPFFRPSAKMQLVPWGQITGAEFGRYYLTLHFSEDQTTGIHLALGPIPKTKRPLLRQAVEGRLGKGESH